jgi:predicted transposase
LAKSSNYDKSMKLTLQTQLLPEREQTDRLKATVERFNEAADWLAGVAYERQVSNKFVLQRLCYAELRERFGLPADTAIRCIAQVVEAFKRDKTKRPRFRKHAAVPFTLGKNIGFKGPDRVSISTLTGRVVIPLIMGQYQIERFGWSKGQCDLVLRRDGKWFLLVTVDVPDGMGFPATDFIGVDLGVERIAVDSDKQPPTEEARTDKTVCVIPTPSCGSWYDLLDRHRSSQGDPLCRPSHAAPAISPRNSSGGGSSDASSKRTYPSVPSASGRG